MADKRGLNHSSIFTASLPRQGLEQSSVAEIRELFRRRPTAFAGISLNFQRNQLLLIGRPPESPTRVIATVQPSFFQPNSVPSSWIAPPQVVGWPLTRSGRAEGQCLMVLQFLRQVHLKGQVIGAVKGTLIV